MGFEFLSNRFQDWRFVLMWPEESSLIFGDNSISESPFKHSPFKFSNFVSFKFFEFLSVLGRISSSSKCCGLVYICVEGLLGELFSMGLGIRFSELKSVMEEDNSEIFCFGFFIGLEFEEEREVCFSRLVGWEVNLTFEFELEFRDCDVTWQPKISTESSNEIAAVISPDGFLIGSELFS